MKKLEDILKANFLDEYDIISNEPLSLKRQNLDFVFNFYEEILRIKKQELEDKDAELAEKFYQICAEIREKYFKAKITFNEVKARFQEEHELNLSEDELSQVESELLNLKNNTYEDLLTDSNKVYAVVSNVFAHNSSVESNLFLEGETYLIEDIENVNKRVAYHAKKSAFDQICMSVFGRHPESYDKGYHIEYIDENHDFNQYLGNQKVKKDEMAFVFVNLKSMSNVNIPNFSKITDPLTGSIKSVDSSQIEEKKLTVPCKIVGKNVKIELPVHIGVIIGS